MPSYRCCDGPLSSLVPNVSVNISATVNVLSQNEQLIWYVEICHPIITLIVYCLNVLLSITRPSDPAKFYLRIELYAPIKRQREELYIILRQVVLNYDRWPSWIYANYQSCPKFPFGQPSWTCSRIRHESKSNKTSITSMLNICDCQRDHVFL